MTIGVYIIKNLVTGVVYVGQSIDTDRRERMHFASLKSGRHKCERLQRSFNKHGILNFVFALVEECAAEELTSTEQSWMDVFKDKYNTAPAAGSIRGIKRSADTKKKMSDAANARTVEDIEKRASARKLVSYSEKGLESIRASMSARMKGKTWSDERKAEFSAKITGKKASEETKLKMSLARAKYWQEKKELANA